MKVRSTLRQSKGCEAPTEIFSMILTKYFYQAEGDEPTNTSVEETPEGEGGHAEPKEDAATEEKEAIPEEPKTLTLDEWKAQQAKKDAPKFNVRKAGEGSDIDPKWKKATIYKKENEEESEEEEEESVSLIGRELHSDEILS